MKRRNGEGSWGRKNIGKNKYHYFRDSNGKYTYGKTVKEVNEKLKKNKETFVLDNKTTFGEYIQEWLRTKRSSIEPTTYDCYETMINSQILNFKVYDICNIQLNNLSSKKFQEYLDALATKYSRATIKKIWVLIKQCVKVGEIKREIPLNCTAFVKVPIESEVAVKKKNVPFLTKQDADSLYNTLNIVYNNGVKKYNENAHAIILIMYSGMRVSEMTSLRWKNVDIKNKKIYITEASAEKKVRDNSTDKKYVSYTKTPKTKESIRSIPLPKRGMEMIMWFHKKYPNHKPNDFVCTTKNGTQIARRNINKTLKAMIRDANCSIEDFSVHSLRHTYGSILLSEGVEIKKVSELLGHEDITTTYNIYIGILEKDKKDEVERVFDK